MVLKGNEAVLTDQETHRQFPLLSVFPFLQLSNILHTSSKHRKPPTTIDLIIHLLNHTWSYLKDFEITFAAF